MQILLLSLSVAQAEPCQPRDLAADAVAAVTAVIDDELEQAIATSQAGVASLECADRVPNPEDLASLWQAMGTAQLSLGDLKGAEASLRQAAAVNPGWFNERLGPRARAAWAGVRVGEPAALRASPMPATATLVVDGLPRQDQPVELAAGTHLVQVLDGEALVLTRVLTLEPGQSAELPTGLEGPARHGPQAALWLGVASGVLAGGAYAGALWLDGQLDDAVADGSTDLLASRRQQSLILGYGVAPALAVGAVTGLTLHFALR